MALATLEQYEKAPWMRIAESYLGVREFRGDENPIILKFFADSGHSEIKDDETAWCSAFANAVMFEAKRDGTRNLMAKSWLRWKGGTRVTTPRFGDIVVFNRGKPSSPWGHVAFFVGWDANTITVLGGNQGEVGEVSVAKRSRQTLVGFMRPNDENTVVLHDKPSVPAMTDVEKIDDTPVKTVTAGTVTAAAVSSTGHFGIALSCAAVTVLLLAAIHFRNKRRAAVDTELMTPKFKPDSYVAAEQAIAEFEPPAPTSVVRVVAAPKRAAQPKGKASPRKAPGASPARPAAKKTVSAKKKRSAVV